MLKHSTSKIVVIALLVCLGSAARLPASAGRLKWRLGMGGEAFPAADARLAAARDSLFSYPAGGAFVESSPAVGPDSTVYVGSYDNYLYAVAPDGTLEWKFETGGRVFSSPAVAADGTVIFGSGSGTVYALAADGSLKWEYETGKAVLANLALGLDGTVYVAPWDEYLYALKPDGTLGWKVKLGEEPASWTVRAGPVVDVDGTVYVGADSLYAVRRDGTRKWSFGVAAGRPSNPAAVGGDGTIYFPTAAAVYALHPDGGLKWSYPAGGMSSPALDSQGNLYFGSADSLLYCLDSTGALRWSYAAGGAVHSSPAVGADSTVYFGSQDSTFYALSAAGELKWQFKTGGEIQAPPAIGPDGTAFVASLDGRLYAMDTGTGSGALGSAWPEFGRDSRNSFRAAGTASAGSLKFYFETGNAVSSSPAFGADGGLYFGSWDEYLYAVSPQGFLQWKFKAAGAVSSGPVVGPDSSVYFGSWGSRLYGLHSDGTLKWELYLSGDLRCTPALGADGTLYFGLDGKLRAVSSAGRLLWTYKPADSQNPPAVAEDGTIYFNSGTGGYYLNALYPNGKVRWRFQLGKAQAGGASIGPDSTVYVSAVDLFAVNPDGTLKWKYDATTWPTDSMPASSFEHTPIVGPEGTVYVVGTDRRLHAINPEGTLKWRVRVGAGARMPPVVGADGTVYLASKGDSVFALDPDGSLKWTRSIGHGLNHLYPTTPALGPDGVLYLGTRDNLLIGVETGTGAGLADSGWPRVGHDLRNTGSIAGTYVPPAKNCDFSGDGLVAIGDVIFFLLIGRDSPGDPRLDWNGDGVYDIGDAIALLKDIMGGNCPAVPALLAAETPADNTAGFSAPDLEYLEGLISQMALTPEELGALRLALYGGPEQAPGLPRAFSL
ncbi:MAG: PQQ-binding-like beta-propeller repeat protein, partial [Candidatus Glassbacteria bacterium]|nr:PQQ-binding-like beta-propeller repeat protein [Candidatus Glassbacteria bacterium]